MKHEEFEGFLPRYVSGALPEPEKDRFDLHAAECPLCLQAIHEAITARDLIDGYAMNKLSLGEQEFLERHYFTCPSCLEAVQQTEWLAEGARVAALQLVPGFSFFEQLKKMWAGFQPLSFSPAHVLAILLLLLVYPAWRGLVELPRVKRELAQAQMPQADSRVHMLVALRGPQEELQQLVKIPPPGAAAIPIILQFTLADKIAEDSGYRAAITAQAAGKIIWEEKKLRSAGEYEVFTIVCSSAFFSPGRFQLKVEEVDRNGEEVLQEFVFPFEVSYQ